jgi:hypothetical protein
MADPARYPGTPRWAKIFGITAGTLALIAVLVHSGDRLRDNIPSVGGLGGHTFLEGGH